jgi:hypothetical protein
VIFASLPFYLRLKEKRVAAEPRIEFLMKFWTQIRRRACWQVILCKCNALGCNVYSIMIATNLAIASSADGMISHITFGVMNGKYRSVCLERCTVIYAFNLT